MVCPRPEAAATAGHALLTDCRQGRLKVCAVSAPVPLSGEPEPVRHADHARAFLSSIAYATYTGESGTCSYIPLTGSGPAQRDPARSSWAFSPGEACPPPVTVEVK